MNIVPIVFCFDSNLIFPACVCISSLMMNAKRDTFYDIFILHSQNIELNISELNKIPVFYSNCRIQYRMVGVDFDNAFEIRGITTPAYYRLLIPELIPEYDKILYSDVDVIFRDDLEHYYKENIDDYYFAGVDVGVSYRKDIREYLKEVIKLNPENGYYYSGNLIINSKKIRQDGIIPTFRLLAKNKYKFQDLDVINIACNGHIKPLSPSFCLTNYWYSLFVTKRELLEGKYSQTEIQQILEKSIVHYNGAKPWKEWCYNGDIWWYYYRKSIYFNEKWCYKFYTDRTSEIENWSLLKRIKHVFRYFKC